MAKRFATLDANAVLAVLIVCLLLVIAQVLMKLSVREAGQPPREAATAIIAALRTLTFWLAVATVAVATGFWLAALRSAPLSVVYPFLSLSYVLMVPIGRLFFGEPMTLPKVAGAAIICAGVLLVSGTS